MMKLAIGACFFFAAIAVAPALAVEMMKCDEAGMSKMQTGVMGMTDKNKKDMAMKQMAMAKESMMKKDDKSCMMHMQKVEGMM
jgi:hypothetical protein